MNFTRNVALVIALAVLVSAVLWLRQRVAIAKVGAEKLIDHSKKTKKKFTQGQSDWFVSIAPTFSLPPVEFEEVAVPEKNSRLLFIGDSVMVAGRDFTMQNKERLLGMGFVNILASFHAAHHPLSGTIFHNRGFNSMDMGDLDVAGVWAKDLRASDPTVLTVWMGADEIGNEYLAKNRAFDVARYTVMWDNFIGNVTMHYSRCTVLIIEPAVLRGSQTEARWNDWRAIVQAMQRALVDVGSLHGVRIVKVQQMLDNAVAMLAAPGHWSEDGVHLMPCANLLVAEEWLRELALALEYGLEVKQTGGQEIGTMSLMRADGNVTTSNRVSFVGASHHHHLLNPYTSSNITNSDRSCTFPIGSRVLFAGDSITAAGREKGRADLAMGNGYANLIAAHCGRRLLRSHSTNAARYTRSNRSSWLVRSVTSADVFFFNRGNAGFTSANTLTRHGTDIEALRPNVVSILLGINDILLPGDIGRKSLNISGIFETNLEQLLGQTYERVPDADVILMEPFVFAGTVTTTKVGELEEFTRLVARLQQVVEEVGRRRGLPVVKSGQVLAAAIASTRDVKQWLFDGIHPTNAGHQMLAEEWLRVYRRHRRTSKHETKLNSDA